MTRKFSDKIIVNPNNKIIINKQNRNVIICTSLLSIPFTITLIETYKASSILITEEVQIFNFFTKFYPKLDIFLFKKEKSILDKNPSKILNNICYNYLLRNEINFFLKEFSRCNVYTVIKAFSPLSGYSLLIFSSQNKIFHKNLIKLNWKKTSFTLKFFLYNCYVKFLYGIYFDPVSVKKGPPVPAYSKKFFRQIKAKNMKQEINFSLIKKFISKKIFTKDKEILLLSCGNNEREIIDKDLLNSFIRKLSLNENFKKVIYKRKDSNEKKYGLEKIFSEHRSLFPANLLIHKYKVIVGYNSATLFEAANIGCKSISLLELLGKNKANISYYKDFLKINLNKNKKIFFPKTFDQFLEILNY